MSRTAVLLCVKAGSSADLLTRAVRSTAQSLSAEDAIYMLLDGGDSFPPRSWAREGLPATVHLVVSPHHVGLAAGLNRLIDVALADPSVSYLARMDADDESLPERIRLQREFLEIHPEVDVVGALCREVDAQGILVQQKSLPSRHEDIVRLLSRRNPLNHPTVMFRRRAFDGGVRYRTDVGRMEDYFLWVDGALAGWQFANVQQALLNFTRDHDFFRRRSGFALAITEFRVRWTAMKRLKMFTFQNCTWAMASFLLRMSPAWVQKQAYHFFR